jgi:murein DD-endopeptidase MepM/ murein hydrolase activator NlpD
VAVAATLPGADGAAEIRLEAALEVVEPGFASKELGVAPRFIEPPPRARRRMRLDQAAFKRAFAQEPAPPIFAANFAWPRLAEVTGRFGDKRLFNGKKKSQHYGEDLEGRVGDPVAAANDGRVVLVRDCYASGRSVVIWHGAGLYSVYFHLSRALVRPGTEVRRGQTIGRVGRTGRVTGPHLHWGVKLGDLYVDPESVLRLDFDGSGTTAVARAAEAPVPAPPPAAAPAEIPVAK